MVTPGVAYLELPFLNDGSLDLPKAFELIGISGVHPVKMRNAPEVLQRYEELLREQLDTPSELDRFVAVPESQLQPLRFRRHDELMLCSRIFSFYHSGC